MDVSRLIHRQSAVVTYERFWKAPPAGWWWYIFLLLTAIVGIKFPTQIVSPWLWQVPYIPPYTTSLDEMTALLSVVWFLVGSSYKVFSRQFVVAMRCLFEPLLQATERPSWFLNLFTAFHFWNAISQSVLRFLLMKICFLFSLIPQKLRHCHLALSECTQTASPRTLWAHSDSVAWHSLSALRQRRLALSERTHKIMLEFSMLISFWCFQARVFLFIPQRLVHTALQPPLNVRTVPQHVAGSFPPHTFLRSLLFWGSSS
jgi:hypothetical protein